MTMEDTLVMVRKDLDFREMMTFVSKHGSFSSGAMPLCSA